MEMDEPLLRPSTPTSTHKSSMWSSPRSVSSSTRSSSPSPSPSPSSSRSSISTSHHLLSNPFSRSKFAATPRTSTQYSDIQFSFSPRARSPRSPLSRTRSFCSKLNTEVRFMRLKLSRKDKDGQRKKGKWIKVEGEAEGERRLEMVWRRLDGEQGMIPWGGVGRSRLD